MKRIKLLTALAIGVVASSSGMIQVEAAIYAFFVDFAEKEVADYDDFKQTFNEDTNNLTLNNKFYFTGYYRFDSCPTNFTTNVLYNLQVRANGTGGFINVGGANLPDFLCSTSLTFYSSTINVNLSSTYLDLVVNDDVNFIEFNSYMTIGHSAASNGRTLTLNNYNFYFDLNYNFGTTYLFNYFLSDQKYNIKSTVGSTGTFTFNATQRNALIYVYTTAGNDTYYINNADPVDIGITRKKYAIDYNEEFFRGSSVGAGFYTDMTGSDTYLMTGNSGQAFLGHRYYYYYLNAANLAQAIVDAPIISFTEEDCSGGFLDINVGCYVNNALAYIVNDAPVISDAFTLLNTGIELAAQTFGIIGNFSDDNVFGYLILVGFGFIAVKWFLKNDE
jgi:hypothetical protein